MSPLWGILQRKRHRIADSSRGCDKRIEKTGEGIEECERIRYDFRSLSPRPIATAHTLNDSLETALLTCHEAPL